MLVQISTCRRLFFFFFFLTLAHIHKLPVVKHSHALLTQSIQMAWHCFVSLYNKHWFCERLCGLGFGYNVMVCEMYK